MYADSKDVGLNSMFVSFMKARFAADVRELRSATEVNAWVSEKTRGLIDTLTVPATTKVAIVNAMVIKLVWESKFLKKETKPCLFWLSDKTSVECNMMHQVLEAKLHT
jgi:serine protease inhibitor